MAAKMNDKKREGGEEICDLTEDDNEAETGSTSSDSNCPVFQLCEQGQSAILAGMKAANAMPSGRSRDLYAAHAEFIKITESHADRMLHIISDLLQMHGVQGNIRRRDAEERLEMIQEFNDNLIERINSNLDAMEGVGETAPTMLVQSEVEVPALPRYRLSGAWNEQKAPEPVKATLITGTNIARPQSKFKLPIDNSRLNPFVPKIRDKPNSRKPLAVLPEYDDDGNIVSYLHPYEFELDRFKPAKEMFQPVTPQQPLAIEKTNLMFVDDETTLGGLLRELKLAKEIAIDLEHHSYRSFQGFTCLMQLSTREKDYIVDALTLRDELHVLNEVFTDPKKVKVLHGSISDIEWLQRDLGLYLVNMFDTGEAARVLQFSRIGLQFLLKHYCSIDTDKAFQLADWRIRPLPGSFVEYARKDTHYLLYIYDCMKNELLEKGEGLLQTVLDKSTFICKQRYQKPSMNEDTVMNIYRRSRYVFDHRQMYAFREILYWRDHLARLEDESPGYVLPQHMALDIASKLPREMQGILASCTPVPSLVRQHLHALHKIILKARDLPAEARDKPQTTQLQADTRHKIQSSYDFNNPLVCPHDDTGHADVMGSTNHPTLLGDLTNSLHAITLKPTVQSGLVKDAADISVFGITKIRTINARGHIGLSEKDVGVKRFAKLITLHTNPPTSDSTPNGSGDNISKFMRNKFNTPYERYLETCRLRHVKERKDEENYNKQQTVLKQLKPGSEGKRLDDSSTDGGTIPLESAPATPTAESKGHKQPDKPATALMTQNQLKRLEQAKVRKAVEIGEKLCFNGTTIVEEKQPNTPTHGKRKSFPLAINVSGDSAAIERDLAEANGNDMGGPSAAKQKWRMEPFKDASKAGSHHHDAGWDERKPKTKKGKQRHRNMTKSPAAQGSRQNSNKPVETFDYGTVDYGRFQGGSKPLATPRKGKRGAPQVGLALAEADTGDGSGSKKLHPNSRLAKNIKKTEKMFNLSSSGQKRK
ncbi:exosome component 10 [Anopheles nili]|uniref:exosome component 10 n=1 Tax=Anopheles nili TaxID=185578 RepID=UPI00237C0AE4|nr:exosome component 10 [Anopheles nili]